MTSVVHQFCSLVVARSPNATHKTVGRPRYSQLQVRLANRKFILPKSLSEYTVFGFNIFMSDSPKLLRTTQRTIWMVHWATQDFSLAAALVHAWCDVSEWHKFAIAIVTLVFFELGDCWDTRDSNLASVDRSVTGATTAMTNLAFPIRLLASAFIFLLSNLKLITLPTHSPYIYKTHHYQQIQVL